MTTCIWPWPKWRRSASAGCRFLNSDGDVQAVISIDDIILWAVQQGGITPKELASALRHICAQHAVPAEPETPRF
jgi:hypothetical protein